MGGTAYAFRSIRIARRSSGGFMAVVAATDTAGSGPVVAFGAGSTWGEAFEAANQAVGRGAWKPDKFPGQHWG